MTFTPTEYQPYDFANRRHIGPSPAEMTEMLDATLGYLRCKFPGGFKNERSWHARARAARS